MGILIALTLLCYSSAFGQSATPTREFHMPPPVPAPVVRTGPFGFWYGMTKEQVIALVGKEAINKAVDDKLQLTAAPKGHPAFETYSLIFSPTQGLLKIVAIGKDIQTNDFGDSVKTAFTDLRDVISKTYGPPKSIDFVKRGSLWTDARDWMTGLLKEERSLAALWDNAPNHIRGVILEANALSTSKAYLRLSYEFEGWDEYADSKKAKAGTVF